VLQVCFVQHIVDLNTVFRRIVFNIKKDKAIGKGKKRKPDSDGCNERKPMWKLRMVN